MTQHDRLQNDFSTGEPSIVTCGDYPDEAAACAAFDQAVHASGIFKIYSEVPGSYAYRPHFKKQSEPRIDRILIPNKILLDAGWNCGIVGVEIKRSGVRIGPVISQIGDYLQADWTLPDCGFTVRLGFCFLFPLERLGNDIASVCQQNRIGQVALKYPPYNEHFRIQFFSGEQSLIIYYFNHAEPDRIRVNGKPSGQKRGSR